MASPSLPTCGPREACAWARASDSAALECSGCWMRMKPALRRRVFLKEVLDTRARRNASRALVRARGGAKLQQPGVKFQCISSTKLPLATQKITHECGKLPRLRLSRSLALRARNIQRAGLFPALRCSPCPNLKVGAFVGRSISSTPA